MAQLTVCEYILSKLYRENSTLFEKRIHYIKALLYNMGLPIYYGYQTHSFNGFGYITCTYKEEVPGVDILRATDVNSSDKSRWEVLANYASYKVVLREFAQMAGRLNSGTEVKSYAQKMFNADTSEWWKVMVGKIPG